MEGKKRERRWKERKRKVVEEQSSINLCKLFQRDLKGAQDLLGIFHN